MKLKNIKNVNDFLHVVNSCEGAVWLESRHGDVYNLKSELSQYIAIAALLSNHGSELELYCGRKNDEAKFFDFFRDNPSIL